MSRNGSAALRTLALLAGVLAACGCGAVEVPTVRSYRLDAPSGGRAPAIAPDGRAPAHVLRVQDLRLAAHVSPEHVMVQDGPSLLQAHPLDLWAGSLDRMVTDVVLRALRRSGGFVDVKGSSDVGREDLWLCATVTDFHYERAETAAAVVGFDVQIRRASDQALLVQREFAVRVPAAEPTAPAAVAALGEAVGEVAAGLVSLCAILPVDLGASAAPAAVPGLAEPPSPHGR